jgi:hypothetical protein
MPRKRKPKVVCDGETPLTPIAANTRSVNILDDSMSDWELKS